MKATLHTPVLIWADLPDGLRLSDDAYRALWPFARWPRQRTNRCQARSRGDQPTADRCGIPPDGGGRCVKVGRFEGLCGIHIKRATPEVRRRAAALAAEGR